MEWRGAIEEKNPRTEIPPNKHSSPCASGSEAPWPSATDRDSVGGNYFRWREWEETLRVKKRREEEEEVLREKQRREKRERRKKQQREKKERAEKRRRQKKELREKEEQLRGLRRSAASTSGGMGADVHASNTGSGLPDSTIMEPSAGEEALPLRVEAGEVSSNELGPTIEDTSSLETRSLNDLPSAVDSTIGAVLHAIDMNSGLPDSSIMASSAEKAVSPRTAKLREFEEYLNEHTFDTIDDFFEYIRNNNERAAQDQVVYQQPSLDKFESQQVPEPKCQPVQVPEESRSVATQGQYSGGSKEEISQNVKKWMIEEVMVAFQKYRERKDDLKDCDYKLDELCNLCFNVDNYNHIFHHFNFTIKMKTAGSTDWISVLYFAEVKEIYGRKIYFCCPLEAGENGHCYACKNQKIDELKHPIIGPFDRGNPDSMFPFTYDSSSSDDDVPKESDKYDEAWRIRMRAAGLMIG